MPYRRSILIAGTLAALATTLPAARQEAPPPPALDPLRIVNESLSFLKEREPEMTETEYALYEKVIPMITAQPDFALKLLEGMVGEADSSAAFEFVLGNVYFEQKRYADAETHLKRAIEKYGTFVRAWDNLGVLYFTTEKYTEAVPCFTKAIILGESEPRLHGLLGFCLFKSGNPLAAEAAYLQAYALESDNSDWIEGLLSTYLESRQFARAESLLRQLVRLKPTDAHFWFLLGNVILTQERKVEAIAHLETALSLNVLNTDGLMMLGDLYAEQRLLPEAVRTYQALGASAPESGVERLVRFANVLAATGSLEQAGEVLDQVGAFAPPGQKAGILQARATIFQARAAWDEARALLEQVIELEPMNGRALFELGEVFEELGDVSRANFFFEAAARIPEHAYAALLKLANLDVKQQRFNDALNHIDRALLLQKSPELLAFQARIHAMVPATE